MKVYEVSELAQVAETIYDFDAAWNMLGLMSCLWAVFIGVPLTFGSIYRKHFPDSDFPLFLWSVLASSLFFLLVALILVGEAFFVG